jgi:hypothetical protein
MESVSSEASSAFDGIWEFQLTGGSYCPIKSLAFRRTVSHGAFTAEDGRKLGAVAADGSFEFSNPSPSNKNITVRSQGTLKGQSGQGKYEGLGTPCEGTYEIRLVEKING